MQLTAYGYNLGHHIPGKYKHKHLAFKDVSNGILRELLRAGLKWDYSISKLSSSL